MHSSFGHRLFVTFTNDFSRYTWLYMLKHKSDIFAVFKDFYVLIKNEYGNTIKAFHLDNGKEYVN